VHTANAADVAASALLLPLAAADHPAQHQYNGSELETKTDSVEAKQEYIEARGGEVHLERAIKRINTDANGEVTGLQMMGKDGKDGEVLTADMYVSAVPCDIIKLMLPEPWTKMPFFRQTDELEGIPVINIHLWFDTKLKCEDHLMFSRSPLLSVYADMSTCCKVLKLNPSVARPSHGANPTRFIRKAVVCVASDPWSKL
jgi:uncharacterized protein with NAD-binding domain and iron-sulfur cluster